MADYPQEITFFEWLVPLIVSGDKYITIRDYAESHYRPGTRVTAYTLETHQQFAEVEILAVSPLLLEDIDEQHAQQEGMSLEQLRSLIRRVYPDQHQLYVIKFRLLNATNSSASAADSQI